MKIHGRILLSILGLFINTLVLAHGGGGGAHPGHGIPYHGFHNHGVHNHGHHHQGHGHKNHDDYRHGFDSGYQHQNDGFGGSINNWGYDPNW